MAQSKAKESRGVFIVLEGADGSGKTTQLKLLAERLRAVGYGVAVFDFPRYEKASSHFIKQYLNGVYGPASQVNPFTASLFYALDRFEAAPGIRKALAEGKIVLADRYAGSNMAHQGAKFTSPQEQRGFFVWEDSLEFNLLGIPRPDLNIFLRLPPEISLKLMSKRSSRSYTKNKLDEHEADINHLRQAVAAYDRLHKLFPKDFKVIDSSHGGNILPIPVINDQIWELIKPLLPKDKPHKPRAVTLQLEPADTAKKAVNRAEPISAEASPPGPTDDAFRFELDKISLLAANSLYEYGNLQIDLIISWLGPKPTFDYYSLPSLPQDLAVKYKQAMGRLIELNKQVAVELGRYRRLAPSETSPAINQAIEQARLTIIPQAALTRLKLQLLKTDAAELVGSLDLSRSKEVLVLKKQIELAFAHKGLPLKTTPLVEKFSQPESLAETINRLSQTHLAKLSGDSNEPVKLLNYWPRNEFEVLVEGLYPYANLSHQEIASQLDSWKYQHKQAILESLIRRSRSTVLKDVNYRWDVICSRLVLNKLLRENLVKDLRLQSPTPRFGYEVPAIIEDAKAEDIYMEAFDLSLQLYSDFQAAGQDDLAPYVTLLGHKQRSQFVINAPDLKQLLRLKENFTELEPLAAELQSHAQQVHPNLSQVLTPSEKSSQTPLKAEIKKNQISRKNRRP